MDALDQRRRVADGAEGIRVLQVGTEHRRRIEVLVRIADNDRHAEPFGAGADHGDHLRMAPGIDEEGRRLAAFCIGCGAMHQRHGLARGGRLVEQRGIGDRHSGEVADHRLEIHDRFHPPLADLGLIGRVGGVPGSILENVALDHGRRIRGVIPLPDEALEQFVFGGDRFEFVEGRRLRERQGEPHRVVPGDARRHDLLDERGARRSTNDIEHAGLVGRADADMPRGELTAAAGDRARRFGSGAGLGDCRGRGGRDGR